jgi:UDP-3-O-[3-hydroxymyristoyl] glucosamine N-acyltransferase
VRRGCIGCVGRDCIGRTEFVAAGVGVGEVETAGRRNCRIRGGVVGVAGSCCLRVCRRSFVEGTCTVAGSVVRSLGSEG